jgi:hypothetical protein
MKNKHIISDNFKKLMDEVNNPQRPLAKWADFLFPYNNAKYDGLLEEVYSDTKGMASKYEISIVDADTFRKNIEELFISVQDYSEQTTFLKDLVMIGSKLHGAYEWKIKGVRVNSTTIRNSKFVCEGVLAGLIKELMTFYEEQRQNNRVDRLLILKLKRFLMGEEVNYPKGFTKDGRSYYKNVEDYLLSSIDYWYRDLNRESAAQSLAICFLGKVSSISIKEGAFIFDLLHYTGYIDDEQKEDKELETYPEKHKYDTIKEYFGVGGKSNKK